MKQKQRLQFCDVIASASHHLREYHQLSEKTIKKHLYHWRSLLDFAEKQELTCVQETICEQFIDYHLRDKQDTLVSKHSPLYSIKLLEEYIRNGEILSTKEAIRFYGEIGVLMDKYILEKTSEHLRQSSIHTYKLQLSRFLRYLSGNSINYISDIRLEHVLLYIKQLSPEHKSNLYIAAIIVKRFFKWLFDRKLTTINLSIQIPSGRYVQQSELPSVYTKEEIEQMLKTGVDRGNSTGKRNYLILLLAARLGLRASDICNLQFENIQWDRSLLLIEQTKTGKTLELPLLADVGNAIIDYLRYGRPKSEEPYVLLTANTPHRKMLSSSTFSIVTSALNRAGVSISNKKHGAHALRHSFAARMLEGRTTLPVISEVLGHEKTDSTMYYLRIDINSLSACMLDVPFIKEDFYDQFKWNER
jgi:site-specific recombinase XerD